MPPSRLDPNPLELVRPRGRKMRTASLLLAAIALLLLSSCAKHHIASTAPTTAPASTGLLTRITAPMQGELPRLITLAFTMAAFLATFYALLRNNPTLRPEAGGIFYSIALALFSGLVFLGALIIKITLPTPAAWCTALGATLLLATILLVVRSFWRSYVRMHFLHEGRGSWKFFILVRLYRWIRPARKTYEFSVTARETWTRHGTHLLAGLPDDLFDKLNTGGSLLLSAHNMPALRCQVFTFIAERLNAGDVLNYISTVLPPYAVLSQLRSCMGSQIPEARFVLVDMFSQPFGFSEDVITESSVKVQESGVHVIRARNCAGLHRALKRAFNYVKQQQGKRKERGPSVVVYDSISTLALVDSEEQVRIFLHHMIPAECSYKMTTLLLEHSETRCTITSTMAMLADGCKEIDAPADSAYASPNKTEPES